METLDSNSYKNLELLAEQISQGKRVTFITGAGLSVASGIRPYRSGANGIWNNFVVEMCRRETFKQNPSVWWNEFWLRTHETPEFIYAKPNAGHEAITKLVKLTNGKVITQNIDTLHLKAGIPESKIAECHGRLRRYKCINDEVGCKYASKECIYIDNIDEYAVPGTSLDRGNLLIRPPVCPSCGGFIMPQTLLFDEAYASHISFKWIEVEKWCAEAEIIIYVGTSFSVGITTSSHEIARSRGIFEYNFNIDDATIGNTIIPTIKGKAEVTLPLLAQKVIDRVRNQIFTSKNEEQLVNAKLLKTLNVT